MLTLTPGCCLLPLVSADLTTLDTSHSVMLYLSFVPSMGSSRSEYGVAWLSTSLLPKAENPSTVFVALCITHLGWNVGPSTLTRGAADKSLLSKKPMFPVQLPLTELREGQRWSKSFSAVSREGTLAPQAEAHESSRTLYQGVFLLLPFWVRPAWLRIQARRELATQNLQ